LFAVYGQQLGAWFLQYAEHHLCHAADAWQAAEAVLHAASAVAKTILSVSTHTEAPGDAILDAALQEQVVAAISSLPLVTGLQSTACVFLGMAAPWASTRGPDVFAAMARVVVMALRLPMTPEGNYCMVLPGQDDHVACVALMKLSRSAHGGMAYSALADIFSSGLNGGQSEGEASVRLSTSSKQLLLQATCQSLQRTEAVPLAQELLGYLLRQLRHAATTNPQATLRQELEHCAIFMRTGLCAATAPAVIEVVVAVLRPGGNVAEDETAFMHGGWLLPLLLARRHYEETLEGAKILSQAIATSPAGSAEQVGHALVAFWGQVMADGHTSHGLDILKLCAEMYSGSEAIVSLLHTVVHDLMANMTLADLAGDGCETRLAASLFTCLAACIAAAPPIVGGSLQVLLGDLTVGFLGTPSHTLLDGPVANAANAFVQECLQAASNEGPLAAEMAGVLADDNVGVGLFYGLMCGCCGFMPSWMLNDLAITLMRLFRLQGVPLCCQWVAVAINQETFPRYLVSDAAKAKFVQDVSLYAGDTNWGKFKQTVKQFCGGKKKTQAGPPKTKSLAVS